MPQQSVKKIEQLLKLSNKVKLVSSISILIFLIVIYFTVANFFMPTAGQITENTTREFVLSIISGIIPVFLLFVLSYYTLNEINNLKDEHKEDTLSTKVSENILNSMDWSQADKFFFRKTDESLFIKEAENKLYLIQETGSLISEKYRSEIVNFLNRNGEVILILTIPNSPIAKLMSFRNSSLNASDDLLTRAKQFESQIKDIITKTINYTSSSLVIRYIAYPIDFTMIMADANSDISERKKALIRLAGFKVPFEEKLDFKLSYISSPLVFLNYEKQFFHLYYSSSKIVLLSGESKSGKTTLLNKLVEEYSNSDSIEYILSNQILDVNTQQRIGFEIKTSLYNKTKRFATKLDDGTYEVNQDIWDDIANKLDKINIKKKIIILDEIGIMQIQSKKFRKMLIKLVSNPESILIASIADTSETFFNELKNNYRTKTITLNTSTLDKSQTELKLEINGSLKYLLS